MALSDQEKRQYSRRILMSRTRVLCNHGFYGMLLMHMKFALDESCDTAYTDGEKIAFSPAFMDKLSDSELDFILMHEVLHVALAHCYRGTELDQERFNIACDIVVNSNILKANDMKRSTITLNSFGESMNKTPNGKDGYLFSAEEVYEMLSKMKSSKKSGGKGGSGKSGGDGNGAGDGGRDGAGKSGGSPKKGKGNGGGSGESWDDHSRWKDGEESEKSIATWLKRVKDTVEVLSIDDPSNSRGLIPAAAQRLINELRTPQTDWRKVLDEFVQEEICDYSFSPPDRRFSESDFFLPDFNDTEVKAENVLFMVDTSGSISDNMITAAYSEIAGAIAQFNGKLSGMLGFFDAQVYPPIPFESVDDVKKIRPRGGGGTSFDVIFEYVNKNMADNPPASIVILTDGYAPFPPQSEANEIPVLWLINNERVTPPWGKITRIKV